MYVILQHISLRCKGENRDFVYFVESILDLTSEECPPAISTALLDCLAAKMGEDATINSLQGVSQRELSLKIDLKNLQLLTDHISELGVTRDITRLACLGLPHAGDWLNVVPSPALGLHLCLFE